MHTPPLIPAEEACVLYATALMHNVGPMASAISGKAGVQSTSMVTLQKRAMHRVVPPPATVAEPPGPPSLEVEPMVLEEASPSGGKPTLVPEAPAPGKAEPNGLFV